MSHGSPGFRKSEAVLELEHQLRQARGRLKALETVFAHVADVRAGGRVSTVVDLLKETAAELQQARAKVRQLEGTVIVP